MFRAVINAQIKSYVSNLGTVTRPAAILGASFAYKEAICRLSELVRFQTQLSRGRPGTSFLWKGNVCRRSKNVDLRCATAEVPGISCGAAAINSRTRAINISRARLGQGLEAVAGRRTTGDMTHVSWAIFSLCLHVAGAWFMSGACVCVCACLRMERA